MSSPKKTNIDRIYRSLRQALAAGKFRHGEQLKEEQLAARYKVSRTPLREAMSKLVNDGLLVSVPYRGVFVREHTLNEAQQLFELRAVLESFAARLAARRASSSEHERIRRRLTESEEAIMCGDLDEVIEANTKLHQAICNSSRNVWLCSVLDDLRTHFGLLRSTTLGYNVRREQVIQEHRALLKAIEMRDEREAERIAREHIEHAWTFMLGLSDWPTIETISPNGPSQSSSR